MKTASITLTGRDLTSEQLSRIARHHAGVIIAPEARDRIAAAEATVLDHLARGTPR